MSTRHRTSYTYYPKYNVVHAVRLIKWATWEDLENLLPPDRLDRHLDVVRVRVAGDKWVDVLDGDWVVVEGLNSDLPTYRAMSDERFNARYRKAP